MIEPPMLRLLLAFACFALALPSFASAQDEERARALFEQGVAAFDGERYAEALSLFEESYELQHSQQVLYNMAVAERQMGRDEDALTHLYQWIYLDAGQDRERRRAVQSVIDALSPRLATLRLTRDPEDLTLRVDGVPVSMTGDGVVALRPGAYELLFEAEGYQSEERNVTLEAGSDEPMSVSLSDAADVSAGPFHEETPSAGEAEEGGGLVFTWIAGALTLGFAGLAVGAFIAAESAYEDRQMTCAPFCTPDDLSEIETWDMLTTVGIIGASVMGAATVVLALIELDVFGGDDDEHQVSIGPGTLRYRARF